MRTLNVCFYFIVIFSFFKGNTQTFDFGFQFDKVGLTIFEESGNGLTNDSKPVNSNRFLLNLERDNKRNFLSIQPYFTYSTLNLNVTSYSQYHDGGPGGAYYSSYSRTNQVYRANVSIVGINFNLAKKLGGKRIQFYFGIGFSSEYIIHNKIIEEKRSVHYSSSYYSPAPGVGTSSYSKDTSYLEHDDEILNKNVRFYMQEFIGLQVKLNNGIKINLSLQYKGHGISSMFNFVGFRDRREFAVGLGISKTLGVKRSKKKVTATDKPID